MTVSRRNSKNIQRMEVRVRIERDRMSEIACYRHSWRRPVKYAGVGLERGRTYINVIPDASI